MRRREFIGLLGGVAVGWPLATSSQQADRMKRIGMLQALAANDPEVSTRIAAFQQGFKNWAGSKAQTSKSTIGGLATTSNACEYMRQN
jgi:hypothetical protein